jgi:mono/diheme cytochrome c family protein
MIRVSVRLLAFVVGIVIIGSVAAENLPGKMVFEQWCTACHMDSPFAPGTIQLKQIHGPAYAIIEKRIDLTDAFVRLLVRQGRSGMPKFRRTEISNADLDALVNYLVRPQ